MDWFDDTEAGWYDTAVWCEYTQEVNYGTILDFPLEKCANVQVADLSSWW